MSYYTLNVILLKEILKIIDKTTSPLPNHRLANTLDVHPATVKNTLARAKELLKVSVDTTNKGYIRVSSWGVLDKDLFLS